MGEVRSSSLLLHHCYSWDLLFLRLFHHRTSSRIGTKLLDVFVVGLFFEILLLTTRVEGVDRRMNKRLASDILEEVGGQNLLYELGDKVLILHSSMTRINDSYQ